MAPKKTVLITGCSDGGIGSALAFAFQRRGFRVFASLRNRSKAAALADLPDVDIVELDVTSPASLAAAAKHIEAETGGRLDVLVNNAGGGYMRPLLDASIDDAKGLFEVNVWGCLAAVQAVAPMLVASKGTVVNISSIAGVLNSPYNGVYAASKAALNSMSETLRIELEPLGVSVATVFTGVVTTNFMANCETVRLSERSFYLAGQESLNKASTGESIPYSMPVASFAEQLTSDVVRGYSGPIWRGSLSLPVRIITGFLPLFVRDMISRRGIADVKQARARLA